MVKTNFYFILILLSNFFIYSQTSLVNYNVDIRKKLDIKKDSSEKYFDRKINNLIRSAEEGDYRLIYTNTKSVFIEEEKMEVDNSQQANRNSIFVSGSWYKNLKDSLNIRQKSSLGELFNISHPINIYDWKITNESKYISGYLCYKAIASMTVNNIISNKKEQNVTEAWFAPDIPVPFGPAGIDGLPGLVLVCSKNNGTINFFATKIIFDIDLKIDDIINLKKGKNISNADYTKLITQRFNMLRNNN